MFEIWFGVTGQGEFFSGLSNIAPPMLGMLMADFVAAYSAIWIGSNALKELEGTNYWRDSETLGSFINYGGISLFGNLNGILISFWMLMYFMSAISMIGVPLYLTRAVSLQLQEAGGSTENMFRQLNHGLLLSVSSYIGAWALVEVQDILIDRFNNYNADEIEQYYKYLRTNPHLSVTQAMFWDLINHTLITVGFIGSSMTIPASSWIYIYNELHDTSFSIN